MDMLGSIIMARFILGRNGGMRVTLEALSVGFRMGKLINLEREYVFRVYPR